jgi:hydroxyacylglutathione hydrolase
MALKIEQFICRSDNFGVLAHDEESGETALIDAPELSGILEAIERTGWKPTQILTTHHHGDHVEANLALKQRFNLTITGPAAERTKIPGIDGTVAQGDTVRIGRFAGTVIETPGHTAGHVSFHFPEAGIAFTGDTLFALGCGRLLEGTPATMFRSLARLAALPDDTLIYCGHEYTLSNARFAVTVDPDNKALQARRKAFEKMAGEGRATLPVRLGDEKATNPFLRASDAAIKRALGMEGSSDEAVFAEIRRRKDSF